MRAARVLLVEDDPAMVRFFEMVADDFEVSLQACPSVAQAIETLREQPVDLIVTDLMLPGEPGTALLHRLREEPALRGAARVVVCSAGIDAPMKEELVRLGVWRQLDKPVSVQTLQNCLREGLSFGDTGDLPAQAPLSMAADVDEAGAVTRYFGGNRALFDMYRQACVRQFPVDIGHGDQALAERDTQAVRRLGHSLKTVLLSLGWTESSAVAKRLEQAAQQVDWDEVQKEWPPLRATLSALCAA